MRVRWDRFVQGTKAINAGQAVEFYSGPNDATYTVTEGTSGTAAVDACVDDELAFGHELVVTFYQPGDYNLFCRVQSTMEIVIQVQ